MNVAVDVVRAQILAVLAGWSAPADTAATVADVLVAADLAGVDSHGVTLLTEYAELVTGSRLDVTARPSVAREAPATALVDAGGGFGHPAGVLAMRLAVAKAERCGVGATSVVNSHHFGAAGYYAALAEREGMVGIAMTTAHTVCVVPTRGAVPMLTTNPIACAAPDFLLDMSTSTVAVNKVRVRGLTGQALPAGWAVDEAGSPVADAEEAGRRIAEHRGGLTPLGGAETTSGYKGYGLNVMVQLLAGALGGGSFAAIEDPGRGGPDNIGHFFVALDPAAFRDAADFRADVAGMLGALRATPPLADGEPVLVAGDREAATRQHRAVHGIPVPDAVADGIRHLCAQLGVPFLLAG